MAEAVVQRMVPGGVETIVAVESHPAFGPVIGFGLGGAFADAIADRPARSLPLTDLDATELVASSRAAGAIDDAGRGRGRGRGPAGAGRAAGRRRARDPARMRLNPVLVSPAGAWALDVRIHVAPAGPLPDAVPLRRL